MDTIELHIHYGNPDSELWEDITYFEVSEYIGPDFTKGFENIQKKLENDWQKISLADELLKIMVIKTSDNFTINVRQEDTPLFQVMCQSFSSACFRTLTGKDISLQVHELGTFKLMQESSNA